MLADFGIALRPRHQHSGEHLTEQGHRIGTPMYMAPEQAMAEPPDPRADQFALAAICYEMLAGTPPHAGPTIHAVDRPAADRGAAGRAQVPARCPRGGGSRARPRAVPRSPATGSGRSRSSPPRSRRPRPATRRRVPRSAWIAIAAVVDAARRRARHARRPRAPCRRVRPPPRRSAAEPVRPARGAAVHNLGDSADAVLRRRNGGRASRQAGRAARARGHRPRQLQPVPGEWQDAGRDRLGARRPLSADRHGALGEGREAEPRAGEPRADRGAAPASPAWQQPFDAAFTDVFAVQAKIAGEVAGALHLALADSTRARLTAPPTRNLEAYARFLRSRELRAGEIYAEVLRASIAELQEAVRLDPQFVAAWADLAQVQVDAFRHGGLMVADADGGPRLARARQGARPDLARRARARRAATSSSSRATSPGRCRNTGRRSAMLPQPERPAERRWLGRAGPQPLVPRRWPTWSTRPGSTPAHPTPPAPSARPTCASGASTTPGGSSIAPGACVRPA